MNPNWSWEKVSAYQWGMWAALNPHLSIIRGKITSPFWWKGFVNGTIDYELKKRGLK